MPAPLASSALRAWNHWRFLRQIRSALAEAGLHLLHGEGA